MLNLISCYKIFHGLVNLRFDDFFSLTNSITRGHKYKLKKQHSSVDACKFYFSNHVVDCWNCSPYHVANASFLHSFKMQLQRSAKTEYRRQSNYIRRVIYGLHDLGGKPIILYSALQPISGARLIMYISKLGLRVARSSP